MKRKKIAIVLRLSGAAGRNILAGIFLFLRKHPHWQTHLFQMPDDFTPAAFRMLEAERYDGLIASEPGPAETSRLLARSEMPVAFIGDGGFPFSRRRRNICHIRNDDVYIGRQGARFLLSLGRRRAFGFIPTTSVQYWSRLRQQGFLDELVAHGVVPHIFASPGQVGGGAGLAALRDWLTSLPKPCALMAAWDTRATQVLQICQEARIRVPKQLALLGVNNDELLDESATPPLTSIMPNHEMLGFVAARELGKLMARKPAMPFLARPLKLVERESTASAAPAAHLIARALDFIHQNAVKGITVADVVNDLGISRRLADLRFHEYQGETINETITRAKLDAVKKMLSTTTRSIRNVSLACGYPNTTYLKVLFKRRFGMTMGTFRKSGMV